VGKDTTARLFFKAICNVSVWNAPPIAFYQRRTHVMISAKHGAIPMSQKDFQEAIAEIDAVLGAFDPPRNLRSYSNGEDVTEESKLQWERLRSKFQDLLSR
jgi:hypothetical protein